MLPSRRKGVTRAVPQPCKSIPGEFTTEWLVGALDLRGSGLVGEARGRSLGAGFPRSRSRPVGTSLFDDAARRNEPEHGDHGHHGEREPRRIKSHKYGSEVEDSGDGLLPEAGGRGNVRTAADGVGEDRPAYGGQTEADGVDRYGDGSDAAGADSLNAERVERECE